MITLADNPCSAWSHCIRGCNNGRDSAPSPSTPPVIYVRTEVPPHTGEGDAGFGLLIFLILAIVVALAAQ